MLATTNIFALLTVPLMYLMMATHRWTHCPPGEIPWLVWVMQKSNMFLTIKAHNIHHGDFAHNFALLTGWSNVPLNFVCDHILQPKHTAWMGIFLLWAAAFPACFAVYDICRLYDICRSSRCHRAANKTSQSPGLHKSGKYAPVCAIEGAHREEPAEDAGEHVFETGTAFEEPGNQVHERTVSELVQLTVLNVAQVEKSKNN